MYSKFNSFHSKWLKKETDEDEVKNCNEWLQGVILDPGLPSEDDGKKDSEQSSDQNPSQPASEDSAAVDAKNKASSSKTKQPSSSSSSKTKKIELNREDSAPFRTFCKYKVESS